MLEFWLYVSETRAPLNSVDDALILLQSGNRNMRHAVTGYLHRERQYYCQYVEGPPATLVGLKQNIRADKRHAILRDVAEGRVAERRFCGWDMAFTTDETESFRARQSKTGGQGDICRASEAELLEFMQFAALGGRARRMAPCA